jgi:hypothetical protein
VLVKKPAEMAVIGAQFGDAFTVLRKHPHSFARSDWGTHALAWCTPGHVSS